MSDQLFERRLAAIVAADVVGYSRMMGLDETGTLTRLKTLRQTLIEPMIVRYHGRIVKLMGDGVLIEFPSVVDALACSVQIQRAIPSQNETLPEEQHIELRVGINLGDVIVEGDDLYGDGVNIAARIEPLAEPGGICVSESARQALGSKLPLDYEDMGAQSLKNITEAVRAFRVNVRPDAIIPEGSSAGLETAIDLEKHVVADVKHIDSALESISAEAQLPPDRGPSLTVLPFENLSSDPENAFLADGLTEDVVTALSKLREFFVTDRNTTFALKSETKDAALIAQEMGVRYILLGNVRSAGTRLRVTARLIDTNSGTQLWSERYDREIADIFTIQDELTESLVGHLSPELYAAEHARLKRKHPANLDAWECFVNAMHQYSQQSQEGSKMAIELLERAIELDSDYAQALGLYATILAWRAIQRWEPLDPTLNKARAAADKAVLNDTNDPWASIGRGYVSIVAREGDAAIVNFGRAVDLSPNFAYARALLGVANAYAGNADVARTHITRAIALSPRDTFLDKFYLYLAIAEFQAANYYGAADAAQRAIQIKPGHPSSHLFRTAALALAKEPDLAKAALCDFLELVPNARALEIEKTVLYYKAEDRKRAADGMRCAGLSD